MGKPEDDEFSLSTTVTGAHEASGSNNAERRECRVSRFIGFRCLLALVFGIAVFLSALFWLPPFLKFTDPVDIDLDPRYRGHTIVASFKLMKPVAFLKDNVAQLEADIYYELEAASAKVVILSLENAPGFSGTDVVFGVDPESKHSSISPAEQSLIRESFGYLVTRQTSLQLTTSLFGQPEFFEVLKFPGGITISPPLQHTYPLQNVQILFNFTLNNPIVQIQENFEDLRNQLWSGLHLTYRETLYIRLTNFRGSTVAPPTTVQTSVVMAIGLPSMPRMKQLAKTIIESPARNLGLNNTIFGKVKQVSLSSELPHSLNSPAPAPTPLPPLPHHHHHYHHHHHHHHHQVHGGYLPPTTAPSYSPVEAPSRPVMGSPAPSHQAIPVFAPAPVQSYQASPRGAPVPSHGYQASPPGCRFGPKKRHRAQSPGQSPTSTAVTPSMSPSPRHAAASPHPQAKPPTPVIPRISPFSPLPNVIYARSHPPSGSEMDPEPPDKMPSIAPSPSSGGRISAVHWVYALLVSLLLLRW